jgi:hypothetical protein
VAGERAAGKSGAGAAADEWSLIAVRELHDALDFGGGARKHDTCGTRDFDGPVVFVEQQLFGAMENGGVAEERLEIAEKVGFHACGAASIRIACRWSV